MPRPVCGKARLTWARWARASMGFMVGSQVDKLSGLVLPLSVLVSASNPFAGGPQQGLPAKHGYPYS